MTTWWTVCR